MKTSRLLIAASLAILLSLCSEPVKKENRPLVDKINEQMRNIDSNHRIRIVEDDFHQGDSVFKVRAYYMQEYMIKIVNILRTSEIERDDYFYFFENDYFLWPNFNLKAFIDKVFYFLAFMNFPLHCQSLPVKLME